ncbi:hypothetical protein [uncultured Clostridium sp.]|uniref:hypothetical protein n=1 Tax=uncultured Clostridium sp. TaxID=59620 RepID=UPI0026283E7F|nr:hypothetical protein [uncultured Clostridium sp.]
MLRKTVKPIRERYKEDEYAIFKENTDEMYTTHILLVQGHVYAKVSIDKNNNIVENDYSGSEDLRFLLLNLIQEYKHLQYFGEELAVLEFGVNVDSDGKLSEHILIDEESILDTKSFRYIKDKEIGNTIV